MKKCKGQISLFIILGVILIFIGVFAVYLLSLDTTIEDTSKSGTDFFLSYDRYLNQCFEDVIEDAVETLGSQGGVYDLGSYEVTPSDSINTIYYSDMSRVKFILEGTLIHEFELYVTDHSADCIRSLIDFSEYRTDIDTDFTIESTVELTQSSAIVELDYSVKLFNAESSHELDYSVINYPTSLLPLYESAVSFVVSEGGDSNLLCLSCLEDLAEEHKFYASIFSLTPTIDIFTFVSEESLESFRFAIRYPPIDCATVPVSNLMTQFYCDSL